ncbi:MAG: T9SS type A sorting domain-containing protein [Candidatus Latescibacteria bacterium]|nr:T9SS type A sorting domain-containing protein [Candidatus Latescibacterota bacterium]
MAAGTQGLVRLVADGFGGAIVAWADRRSGSGDIYAQRVDGNGSALWTIDGVPICTAIGDQTLPSLVADGANGGIVVWEDDRTGTGCDLFMQRVDPLGNVLWTPNGVAACSNPSIKLYSTAATDGAGGALIAWSDGRNEATEPDVYVQRVNSSGVPVWNSEGVAVCTVVRFQWGADIVSDGAGGAIVAWEDCRTDPLGECSFSDIYAQRVNAAGATQWTANGVAVTLTQPRESNPSVTSDGEGGAIIAWDSADIFAQRISPSGLVLWTPDGVPVCTAPGVQNGNTMIADGTGGVIIAWTDDVPNLEDDMYAGRINASGQPLWGANGMPIGVATGQQQSPGLISDGWGGAIFAWQDDRNGINADDIYAQRVTGSGSIPTAIGDSRSPAFALSECAPNPFSGRTTMQLTLTGGTLVTLQVYDAAGRLVSTSRSNLGVGTHQLEFDGTDGKGRRLSSGVYFTRVTADGSSMTRKMVIVR